MQQRKVQHVRVEQQDAEHMLITVALVCAIRSFNLLSSLSPLLLLLLLSVSSAAALRSAPSILKAWLHTGHTYFAMATSHGAQKKSSSDPYFRRYIGQGEASLSIVVVGESWQGKSSLINGLLGEEIAKKSDDLEFATESVDRYQYEQNGVHVVLFDTPGFGVGDDEEEAETLRKIREACPSIDILLYCIRMDTKRWPTRSDISTIRQ